jgi:hypothetical protein
MRGTKRFVPPPLYALCSKEEADTVATEERWSSRHYGSTRRRLHRGRAEQMDHGSQRRWMPENRRRVCTSYSD